MRKKNENIYLHIINEDYKRIKMNQTVNEAFMRKSEQTTVFQQIPSSAFSELQKTSPSFEATQTPTEPQQADLTQKVGSCNEIADFELITLLQNTEKEEEELLEQKQNLLTIQQELKNKLSKQIEAKKTAINDLKSQILNLENECKTFAQSLGIPKNI